MVTAQPSPESPSSSEPHGALVVYESMFGNTRELAIALAEGLRSAGMRATVHDVAAAPGELAADIDLLVVGAPTHAFSLSTAASRADAVRQGAPAVRCKVGLRDWLAEVSWPGGAPDVATFDTRMTKVRHLPLAASRKTRVFLEERGATVATRPRAFVVAGIKGPLRDGELDRARAWGVELAGVTQARDRQPS